MIALELFRRLRRLSLRARLIALFALLLFAIATFTLTFFPARMEAQARRAAQNRGVAIARVVAAAAAPALEFDDPVNATRLLEWLASTPEARWASLDRLDGTRLASWHPERIPDDVPPAPDVAVEMTETCLRVVAPVRGLGDTTGRLALGFSLAELHAERDDARLTVGGATAGVFIVGLLLCAVIGTVLTAPIRRVTNTAHAIAHGRAGAEAELTVGGHGEVGAMSEALDLMLRRLREQQTILASQSEASVEGILIASRARKVISFNRRLLDMWALEETRMETLDEVEAAVAEKAEDPAAAHALFQRQSGAAAPAGGTAQAMSGELALKDGRTLAYYVAPVTSPTGERFGGGLYFRDITREKRAAAELQEMHARLLDASRKAGMAEVATGMLHNVGNVLNSINVSTTLVREKLAKSRASAVKKAAALLGELAADPAVGLAAHPKGSRLGGYLLELAEVIDAERVAVLAEVECLAKNVEHVKQIVSMQNAYAKAGGVVEIASLTDVVTDAISVHSQALARHDVEIVREGQALPHCRLDRHRVMQILLNLLANAKHAMATNQGPKRLRIATGRPQPDRVRVVVTDNGLGIAPENMARIFIAGFSTRRDGHGFGLHTSALAAQEMGGTLECHSDGPGEGASFTLELPFKGEESHPRGPGGHA